MLILSNESSAYSLYDNQFYCSVLDVEDEQQEEFPEFINIKEEAELLEAERIIDDFVYSQGGRNGNKKEDAGQAVRAIADMLLAMTLDDPETLTEPNAAMNEGWQVKFTLRTELLMNLTFHKFTIMVLLSFRLVAGAKGILHM